MQGELSLCDTPPNKQSHHLSADTDGDGGILHGQKDVRNLDNPLALGNL